MHLKRLLFLSLILVSINSYSMYSNPLFERMQSDATFQEVSSGIAGIRILERTLGVHDNKRVVGRLIFNENGLLAMPRSEAGYYQNGSYIPIPLGTQDAAHQSIPVAPVFSAGPVDPVTSIVPVIPVASGSGNNNNHQTVSHQPEALIQPNVQHPLYSNTQANRNTWSRYVLSALSAGVLVYLAIKLCSNEKINASNQSE